MTSNNAYYLTGIYTYAQVQRNAGESGPRETIQTGDACLPVIAFSFSPEQAQSLFETELRNQPADENPREVTVRKIYVAPVIAQLLTESGNAPLDWPKILETFDDLLQSTPADDFEQGYWVDVDQVVPSHDMSFSVGTLESNVPEDIRSGLNWSSNKQFFFLLQVLPVPAPPPIPTYEQEIEGIDTERSQEPDPTELDAMNVTLPETVAIIQARNAVTAAWLWRKYAASTQWNNHAIRITPLCGTIGKPE